jgi:hypothetical protein
VGGSHERNSAHYGGGALKASRSHLQVLGTHFAANSGSTGGALATFDAVVDVDFGAEFHADTASTASEIYFWRSRCATCRCSASPSSVSPSASVF